MKKRNRLLAMLMALAMVLAYMPAMAFAEDEAPDDSDGTLAIEEATEEVDEAVENLEESHKDHVALEEVAPIESAVEAKDSEVQQFSFSPAAAVKDSLGFDDNDAISIDGTKYIYTYDEAEDEYFWMSGDTVLADYYLDIFTNIDPYYLNDGAIYQYTVNLWYDDGYDEYLAATASGFSARRHSSWRTVWINGVNYELNSTNPSEGAGVYGTFPSLSGNVNILPTVTLSDGVTYTVNTIYLGYYGTGAITSINVPATVTSMDGVGLSSYDEESWDPTAQKYTKYTVIPGFVIYGTNGSYAQGYANKYGIAFSDPVNGTPDGSIAKVKISKPSTAKKAITVKWKKFTKKQLKKAGAISYEIWVATDPGFTNVVKTATAGKKKASKKIKVPAKGTYYVQVRAIKQVGVFKMAGAWSKAKKVKVKK